MIDYKKIKCPKCGKSHFRVKKNRSDTQYDIIPLIFRYTPDPIYKDGVLQNPQQAEPTKEYFECAECHCNFRIEYFDSYAFNTVDEDEEHAKRKAEYKNSKKSKKPREKLKQKKRSRKQLIAL